MSAPSWRFPHISKASFYLTLAVLVVACPFLYGLYLGVRKPAPYHLLWSVYQSVGLVIKELDILTGRKPVHHLGPARHSGSGVTLNQPSEFRELVLLTGFFESSNELRLIDKDGGIVARWPAKLSVIFPNLEHVPDPPASDWNVDIDGALALEDGSVVFNFENIGLVKLDKCGSVVWKLARVTHHTVERATSGGFWVPATRFYPRTSKSPFPPFDPPFSEDTILRVSDDGMVLEEMSLAKILLDNHLIALLSLTGTAAPEPMVAFHGIGYELFHLNDVEELSPTIAGAFPYFTVGDLLLSDRNRNLLMVLNQATRRIVWWNIGPWVRQHDPDFQADGTITVFSNNRDQTDTGTVYGGSTILQINPSTNKVSVLYGAGPLEKFYSGIRGKHQVLSDGRLLVTEFEAGRIFEIDKNRNPIWEYINRFSDSEIAELTEARSYSADYFKVSDWSCNVVSDEDGVKND